MIKQELKIIGSEEQVRVFLSQIDAEKGIMRTFFPQPEEKDLEQYSDEIRPGWHNWRLAPNIN